MGVMRRKNCMKMKRAGERARRKNMKKMPRGIGEHEDVSLDGVSINCPSE